MTENLVSGTKRELESFQFRWPRDFLKGDGFGWPFKVEHPADDPLAPLRLSSAAAAEWVQKMEQIFFAQLRLPLTKPGAPANLKMYDLVSQTLGWKEELHDEFVKFAAELPARGGSKMPGQYDYLQYPVSFQRRDERYLGVYYETDECNYGQIFIRDKSLLFYVGDDALPSGAITAQNIVDKDTAYEAVFWYTKPQTVRYVDLAADGGLTYIQAQDPWEKNKKITYANVTRWFHPKLGRARQMWLTVPNGIPGTPARQAVSVSLRTVFQQG